MTENGSADFISDLFPSVPEGLFIPIWLLNGKRTVWCADAASATRAAEVAANTSDVYVSVSLQRKKEAIEEGNAREKAKAHKAGRNSKPVPESAIRGFTETAAGIGALWADVDVLGPAHKAKNLPPTIEDAKSLLDELELPPTWVVRTGGGLQAWWMLDDLWLFDGDDARKAAGRLAVGWTHTIKAMAKRREWQADSVGDLARVLRVPWTYNRKPELGSPVLITAAQIDQRYRIEHFQAVIDKHAPKPSATPVPPKSGAAPRHHSSNGKYDPQTDADVAREALKHLSIDRVTDYQSWLQVGQALHSVDSGGGMLAEWKAWSRGASEKYDESACDTKWASFDGSRGIRIATLIKWARENGWKGRSQPRQEHGRAEARPKTLTQPHAEPAAVVAEIPAGGGLPFGDWNPATLSQVVNAERLVFLFDGRVRFNVSRGKWLFYDGMRFLEDDSGEVNRLAKSVADHTWQFVAEPPNGFNPKFTFRHAIDSNKSAGVSAMMKLAETELGIPVVEKRLDADQMLLNVRNGTVNLKTGRLRPHDRADLLTKLAPVEFDEDAGCDLWHKFLNRITAGNENIVRYLQRIAGLCLTGDASVQELFVFYGGGANGKSVFLDTITGLMGEYAGEAPPSLLTTRTGADEHPTEIADLAGRRLVVASETEEGARLRIQLVKRLTGNAVLKARFMRQDYFEFPRTHKLILVTNNRPAIKETTNAIWRRVRLVPFTVTIPEEERDTKLLDKLKAEWPGILGWCIEGCIDWQLGGMQTPNEVLVATAEYQSEQDYLTEYLTERCMRGPELFVCRNELYVDFVAYMKLIGDNSPLDKNTFYDRLRGVSGISETAKRVGSAVKRVWVGIRLATVAKQHQASQERLAAMK